MSKNEIIFQSAAHFLPKIALNIEFLIQTISHSCNENHPIIHHYALRNLIEVILLTEKPELKSRFLKELMRLIHILPKLEISNYDLLLNKINDQIHVLNTLSGRFAEYMHQDPFLQSLKISELLTSDSETRSPQLLCWLEASAQKRQACLTTWLNDLNVLRKTVGLYLMILRGLSMYKTIHTSNGYYQEPLKLNSCHLIMVKIAKEMELIPQIQIGHHGLVIRLYHQFSMKEIKEKDVVLDLSVCQF